MSALRGLQGVDRGMKDALAPIAWMAFDSLKGQTWKVKVFGVSLSLPIAWGEPLMVLLFGDRPTSTQG